jgi:hypothetical protein
MLFNLFSVSVDSLTGGLLSGLVSAPETDRDSGKQTDEPQVRAVGVTAGDHRQVYGRLQQISTETARFQTEASFEPGETVTLLITVTGQGNPVTFNISGQIEKELTDSSRRTYRLNYDVEQPHLRSLSGLDL